MWPIKNVASAHMDYKFVGKLFEPLEKDHIIDISCKLKKEAKRFSIDFLSKSDIIPLHISWRFDEGVIVINNLYGKDWDKENRNEKLNLEFPDEGGLDLKLLLVVKENNFELWIDGNRNCEYKRDRKAKSNPIIFVALHHDFEFIEEFGQRRSKPSLLTQITFDNFKFVQWFPSQFKIGHIIAITAIPVWKFQGPPNGSFDIVFHQCHNSKIELRVFAEFVPKQLSGICLKGSANNFPFFPNEEFRISIGFGTDNFHVAVNEKYLGNTPRLGEVENIVGYTIGAYEKLDILITETDYKYDDAREDEKFQLECEKFSWGSIKYPI